LEREHVGDALALRGRTPLSVTCPDCGRPMRKVKKGWMCPSHECAVIRVRRDAPRGELRRVEREAIPRARGRPSASVEVRELVGLDDEASHSQ